MSSKAQIFQTLLTSQRASGVTLAAGKAYFYTPGTTTLKTIYADRNKATPAANPYTLSADGTAMLYGDGLYDVKITTSTGVQKALWEDVSLIDILTAGVERQSGDFTSLNDAITSIGSTPSTLNINTASFPVTANATIPSTLSVTFTYPGTLAIGAYTVTGLKNPLPEWFGAKGDGITNDTAAIQAAINCAHSSYSDVYIRAGNYLVTGLTIPGQVTGTDTRGRAMRIHGQGTGEPFVVTYGGGTTIKSITDAPVIQDIQDTMGTSNGTVEIDHIRFVGTSTTPVVLLQSFYGTSSFHNNVVWNNGTGDGVKITYSATTSIYENYAINGDYVTSSLGAARTGIGFNFAGDTEAGLVTFSKNSSRGWLTGFQISGAVTQYSPKITESECSFTYNGIIIKKANKAVISDNYIEGGDGGMGILDEGDYTTIQNNYISEGYTTAIDATFATGKGTLISGNVISMKAVAGVGIDVTSSAAFGGYNKNVINNSIAYTAGTAGTIGVRINGTDPRINMSGNSFDPRGAWTGAGSAKISDLSVNGVYGLMTVESGDIEIPVLSRGAIILKAPNAALTEADIPTYPVGTTLTVPQGSYFPVTATAAAPVSKFSAGDKSTRLVTFRTTNANMTFTDSAYLFMNGNFTGPGTITFLIDRTGADNYAYEVARTVF